MENWKVIILKISSNGVLYYILLWCTLNSLTLCIAISCVSYCFNNLLLVYTGILQFLFLEKLLLAKDFVCYIKFVLLERIMIKLVCNKRNCVKAIDLVYKYIGKVPD